jgi:hypothetical protein
MVPATNDIEMTVAVGSGAVLGRLIKHHDTELAATSVWNGRVEKLINTSIRLRNPRLVCVENSRNTISLRFVKTLKQQCIAAMMRALHDTSALMSVKLPTTLRSIINRPLHRGIGITGDNPNSPKSASESPEVIASHCRLGLEKDHVGVHGAKSPNTPKLNRTW